MASEGQLRDLGVCVESAKGKPVCWVSIATSSREARPWLLLAQQRNKKQQPQAAIRDTLTGSGSKLFSVTGVKNWDKLPKVM